MNKTEVRFYVCLVFGFALQVMGFFSPPIGDCNPHILVGSGCFLCLGGLSVGLDIKGIIYEFRKLKELEFNNTNTTTPNTTTPTNEK